MAYVYRHLRGDTKEVFYIGIGSDIKYKRAFSKRSRNPYWKSIVNKVGFFSEIIEDSLTWEEACRREQYWISYYGRYDLGRGNLVNMTDGGDGMQNPSEKIRSRYRDLYKGKSFVERFGEERAKEIGEKISKSNTGKAIHSPEHKTLLSEKMKGNSYGKHQGIESREKKRQAFLHNNPGKNKKQETIEKISKSKKGKPGWNKGQPRKRIVCPYCKKEGGEGLMQRWHFDNCKNRNNER